MLFHLIYASRATRTVDDAQLQQMLHRARRNNDRLGVSGALIVQGDYFVQLLEGEPATICQLYQEILADPKHDSAVQLDFSEIDRPHFAEWSMGLLPMTGDKQEVLRRQVGDAMLDPPTLDGPSASHLFDLVHDHVEWLS